jgi:hypothetical protein
LRPAGVEVAEHVPDVGLGAADLDAHDGLEQARAGLAGSGGGGGGAGGRDAAAQVQGWAGGADPISILDVYQFPSPCASDAGTEGG